MKKLTINAIATCSLLIFVQGCAYVADGWNPENSTPRTVFRNIVYFKNTSPYCTVKVFAGKVKQSPHAKMRFNPVRKAFTLTHGGGEHFIEHNFNTDNYYRTQVKWYDKHGRYLNTEYIGNTPTDNEYQYNISRQPMGEQRINLSNQFRRECWQRR